MVKKTLTMLALVLALSGCHHYYGSYGYQHNNSAPYNAPEYYDRDGYGYERHHRGVFQHHDLPNPYDKWNHTDDRGDSDH